MSKIIGVALKPRIRKKDGLLEWKVWFTPYSGAGKVWCRVVAEGRKEAEREKNKLMAEFLQSNSTSVGNGVPNVFDETYIKLMDGLTAESKSEKYTQRCGNVYNRMFRVFERQGTRKDGKKWCFRKELFPNVKESMLFLVETLGFSKIFAP